MTRINVIPVEELASQHLLAEYRELPRVFAQAVQANGDWRARQPSAYTLGTGHVLFFYDRLLFLSARHKQLVRELLKRGYDLKYTECLTKQWRDKSASDLWNDYAPTPQAIELNLERIRERLRVNTRWLKDLPFFI